MCRWIAYNGVPIFIEELVTKPLHSLVEQSLYTKMNYTKEGELWSTNGDGFGIGWYFEKEEPGLVKEKNPAWSDRNLYEICAQIKAKIFLAHIRATTTGAVQRSNAHPFKYRNWLFQHNGHVHQFEKLRWDLQTSLDPDIYPHLEGTTDSETFFLLAMSYGLEKNPKLALKKMVDRVQKASADNKIECGLNLSCALSDGHKLYTLRYATDGEKPKTQFYSTEWDCFKDFGSVEKELPQKSVVIVSEPLDNLSDRWEKVPENSFLTIEDGHVQIEKFI